MLKVISTDLGKRDYENQSIDVEAYNSPLNWQFFKFESTKTLNRPINWQLASLFESYPGNTQHIPERTAISMRIRERNRYLKAQ